MAMQGTGEGREGKGGALVVLTPAAAPPAAAARPLASFLAQLIACHGRLPAYRTRLRASPGEARARYDEADRPAPPRSRFERSL